MRLLRTFADDGTPTFTWPEPGQESIGPLACDPKDFAGQHVWGAIDLPESRRIIEARRSSTYDRLRGSKN